MATEEIKKYIKKRYDRWLDYASYHCGCAGMADEAHDVLNEVLLNLLQKPEQKITVLLNKKSGQYTELDYYVLRMIKLNATSDTSPYRHKYKKLPVDQNVEYSDLEIEDVTEDDYDIPGEIVRKTRIVREIFDNISVSDFARDVFTWRFFCGEKFSEWPGPESEKELFDVYYKVIAIIKDTLNNKILL